MSQEALAGLAGVDRTYISSLERCVYSATLDMLDRLADALQVRTADLLIELNEQSRGPVRRGDS